MPAENEQVVPVVAIDGPSGAGKGTAAYRLAKHLGWHILDSGMIYRVLGLASIRHTVDADDESKLAQLALDLDVEFRPDPEAGAVLTYLDDKDVTLELRSEEAGAMASRVAAFPSVRSALLARQRGFEKMPGLVADGRDMGTVVFPNAPLKVYLTASVAARAKRRYDQLIEKGLDGNLARLSEAIAARDEADMNRAVAPLKPAEDAVIIDSTDIGIEAVCEKLLQLVSERGLA